MNPLAVLALVQGLVNVGAEAVAAWNIVSAVVKENRHPTPVEFAQAGLDDDAAHAAIQALS
jgi:hypothetical protein